MQILQEQISVPASRPAGRNDSKINLQKLLGRFIVI